MKKQKNYWLLLWWQPACASQLQIPKLPKTAFFSFVISCVGIFVYRGFYFGLYDTLKPMFLGPDAGFLLSFCLGYGVTVTAGLMSYPIDTIRRRMMMTSGTGVKYKGSLDCAGQVRNYFNWFWINEFYLSGAGQGGRCHPHFFPLILLLIELHAVRKLFPIYWQHVSLKFAKHLMGPGVYLWPIMEIDFIVFSERGEWHLSAALYLLKILILAKVISSLAKGQRLCVISLHARFSIAITGKWPFFKLQNPSTFLGNHPETFRICLRHENKDICRKNFDEFWWIFRSQKIRSKLFKNSIKFTFDQQ